MKYNYKIELKFKRNKITSFSSEIVFKCIFINDCYKDLQIKNVKFLSILMYPFTYQLIAFSPADNKNVFL